MSSTAIVWIVLVPLILFLTVVMPMWLRLHYREKSRQGRELSSEEWKELEETLEKAEKLEQRIITLERILDETDSNWRDQL